MKKKIILVFILVICLSGCSNKEYQKYDFDYFYFDTPISISIYSYDDIDTEKIDSDIDEILKEYEYTFSTTNKESLAYILNEEGEVEANDLMIELTTKSIETCHESNGTLDITSGQLIELWSINDEDNVPSDQEIDDALKTIDCDNVIVENNTISLINDAKVDYGSVTKGEVANDLEEYLLNNKIDSALLNLGGNIQLVGSKPDDSEFVIGVTTPEIENVTGEDVLYLNVVDDAVVTSGINQRYFVSDDGTFYHHILDLNTGYPSDNNLASVTILTEDGYTADSLSTTAFIMGVEDGIDYINSLEGVEAIFITRDKEIYFTNNTIDYELLDENYTVIE